MLLWAATLDLLWGVHGQRDQQVGLDAEGVHVLQQTCGLLRAVDLAGLPVLREAAIVICETSRGTACHQQGCGQLLRKYCRG